MSENKQKEFYIACNHDADSFYGAIGVDEFRMRELDRTIKNTVRGLTKKSQMLAALVAECQSLEEVIYVSLMMGRADGVALALEAMNENVTEQVVSKFGEALQAKIRKANENE